MIETSNISNGNLEGVLIDHDHTVTISGSTGLYKFSCSCGTRVSIIATKRPEFAIETAARHLALHKSRKADADDDPFEGLS